MEKKIQKPEDVNFDTRVLKYIVAIVDEKGLSKAAEKLYLSQPALSRHLRSVEENLGAPIFFRRHNELQLTNAGKLFINGVRSILHIEQEAMEGICASKQNRMATMAVAAQNLFASFLQDKVNPVFETLYPEITLQLATASEGQIRRMAGNGSVDLGLFAGSATDTPLFFQECLFTSELVFYAAAGSLGLKSSQEHGFQLNHFAGEPMMLGLEDSFLCRAQERLLQENGVFKPDICVRGCLKALVSLMGQGYGNVILPREAADMPPERTFSFHPPQHYSCIAAWCKGRPMTEFAAQYLALVREAFKSFPN